MVRRRTMERMLLDRDRAHRAQQAALLTVIAEQNDRIMLLAGHKYALTPLDREPVALLVEPDDEPDSYPDPEQLPDINDAW